MRRIAAKLVPLLLTSGQKVHRLEICEDLCQRREPQRTTLSRIISGDESWVLTAVLTMDKSFTATTTEGETMPQLFEEQAHHFFDIRSIVHQEFVPEGVTVNRVLLRRLRDNVRRKRPDLQRAGNWILHDDNAPCHRALHLLEFLTCNNMTSLPHPLYSPDLAPADFFLFPRMKLKLKRHRFGTIREIHGESQTKL